MAKKKILIINTFPIAEPQTGGQKRQAAIVEAYESAFDVVRYVGVFFKGYYKHFSKWDIPLPAELTQKVHEQPHLVDVTCSNAIYENPTVKRKMTKILRDLNPDVIQIEQAFPYLGMKRLLEELDMHPQLVFSSHNVEAPMKREILEGVGMPKSEIDAAVKLINDIELELTRKSSLVIACTEADRQYYEKNDAQKTVLARNGMAPIRTTKTDMTHWRTYFADRGINKTALFVASAHPPNWIGFTDMVGLGVGFLDFDARILLAGGVCDYFESSLREEYNPYHTTFWQRVVPCGRPSDASLGALIKLANVIILPITEGGGSNLKTAEAILADKPIVATPHAFRSFENLQDLPNVYIAETRDAFQQAIRTAMTAPAKKRTPEETERAESVLWKNCLRNAVEEVSTL